MAFRFTDSHAQSLITPLLFPGEQILHRARGIEKPWWTFLFFNLGAMFWRYYLVVATNQRVLFIQHKGLLGGYATKSVETAPWQQVNDAKLGWGIFNKNLTVRAPAVGISKTVQIGRFWLSNNFPNGEGIVQSWSQSRALAYGGAPQQQMLAA